MAQKYDATLNLPKTEFPMRAGLPKREPEMLKHWEEMDIYNEMLKKNEGKPLFNLHDGPPFSNGALHMGHALNKSIKDFITRTYAMRGYYTPYIPGWDNHGMPIESAIIKEQKLNHKAMSIADFRSACHAYADHYIDVQREGFKRMGVIGDWEHPYKTMDPGFEAMETRVFGKMYKNGHIYKGLKPVYWCAHDETALAEAEIEYKDDPCTTVYVKFPMHDDLGKLGNLDKSKLFFVIWTTTIWTLPGNLAIALHPSESYVIVKAPNGEMYIMAEALTKKVMGLGGFEDYEIIDRHEGAFFENMLADHPFLPKTSRLVLADYVTMDSGTGCVHTAPGFGADDYVTCKRYGMDMVVPVNDQGKHTDYAGKYAGMGTDESNPVILKDMKESGMLFASEEIIHSYPHCWRCKHPIIFRATPQWFCSVDSFKDEATGACEDVRWVPAWGKDRMRSMILERTDWCISRLAEQLGKREDAALYAAKGQAYRNIFDREKGWFRPRRADGAWEPWPENARTTEWYGCIESNPYQQGWFVPHDVEGMVELMGGREAVLRDLTEFFDKTPSDMLWNDYYNHANEPVHLVPFLFNRLGQPWQTQKWTRHICEKAYADKVEGIVGNEDAGQMSAWYVLAAAGLHPACPGDTRMEITSPVFDRIELRLDPAYAPGGTFTVVAHGNSPSNVYIQRAVLNGREHTASHLDFADIAAGGTLELYMGDTPNTRWGI